jgi:hypothetical protein
VAPCVMWQPSRTARQLTRVPLRDKGGAVEEHRGLRKRRKVKVWHERAAKSLQPRHRLRPGVSHSCMERGAARRDTLKPAFLPANEDSAAAPRAGGGAAGGEPENGGHGWAQQAPQRTKRRSVDAAAPCRTGSPPGPRNESSRKAGPGTAKRKGPPGMYCFARLTGLGRRYVGSAHSG